MESTYTTSLATSDYYPYGMPHATATAPQLNRRKYGAKDLTTDLGLNLYDFAARWHNPAFPRFTTPDPLTETYTPISPYTYCASDPINLIDPTGMDIYEIDEKSKLINQIENKNYDKIIVVRENGKPILDGNGIVKEIELKYGTIEGTQTITIKDGTVDLFKVRGDKNGIKVLEFLSNYFSGNEGVEFSMFQCGYEGSGPNFITTSHNENAEWGAWLLVHKQLKYGYTVRNILHNHPRNTPYPSGFDEKGNLDGTGDLNFAIVCNNIFGENIRFFIYLSIYNKYIQYSPKSKITDFEK